VFVRQARRQADGRRRLLTGAFSAAVHAAAIAALLLAHSDQPAPAQVEMIPVTLVPPLEPPAPKAETEKPPTPAEPPPPSLHARAPRARPPPEVEPLSAAKGPAASGPVTLSDAQTAGAATAEGGGGGGAGCNMARWLQSRLRKDPLVQSAMADAHAQRPLLIWNGDWVRHGEQEGAGLAAVREAIMWEVGFAPVACRSEPVHGYVLISLNDAPGAARLAMGAGDWRWSDLLGAHRR